MRLLDRLITTFVALIAFANAVIGLAVAFGWQPLPWAEQLIMSARGDARFQTGLLALLVAGSAAYVLSAVWQHDPERVGLNLPSERGDVRVSLRAVESLVLQAANAIRGVRDVHPQLSHTDGRLNVDVSVLVTSDRNIPEVTAEVQQRVDEHIRAALGAIETDIGVTVRNISDAPARPRVE